MAYRHRRTHIGLVGIIYLVIGLFVAWDRGYITPELLGKLLSAVLAVVLWFLVLLGVDLTIDT
ncbi:hypothetical protein BJF79_30500 [Actinomadura sp. CNU-125]|uniref:hypothetical protein n=1 Tax=Actinomadura sp. CNU-125 TaxID=1904961 RepID=UPI00095F7803|nr:hypothetical protein [Actinomadura sp. CNU-125]OLT36918.1 hypothetical protein BJF79_30500 [Actinomadura sp. CNU-125]